VLRFPVRYLLAQLESELSNLVRKPPEDAAVPSILDAPSSPDIFAIVDDDDDKYQLDLSSDEEGVESSGSLEATPVPVDEEFASSLQLNPLFRCFGIEV
jgi:hypothetical protein